MASNGKSKPYTILFHPPSEMEKTPGQRVAVAKVLDATTAVRAMSAFFRSAKEKKDWNKSDVSIVAVLPTSMYDEIAEDDS